MPLTLLAVSLNDSPLSQPLSAFFDGHGGTIGRADHNTMALPDPERHISRLQAEIVASGEDFVIRNVGGANPIIVAGQPVPRGAAATLTHGDELRIGGYVLQVDRQAIGPPPDRRAGLRAPPALAPSATEFEATAAGPITPLDQAAADQTVVFGKNSGNAERTLAGHMRSTVEAECMQRLWAAFCEGAEIDLPLGAGPPQERLRELGRVMRSAVDGTLRLMAVRASTKGEFGADVTVIRGRDNNPLKFSPDATVGLGHLLQPPVQGFLPGPAAMDDAMQDLVGHSVATVAGLRAAVTGMLDRFSPQALEAKLTGNSVLDSLLPAARKSKLWDAYLQHHGSIRSDAQEDFQTLFGKAFLEAYDQQVAQLRQKPLV